MDDRGFNALLGKALEDPVFRRALNALTAIHLGCADCPAALARATIDRMAQMMERPDDHPLSDRR